MESVGGQNRERFLGELCHIHIDGSWNEAISFGLQTAVPQLNSPIELELPRIPLYVM